jgi:hypothetical protein
MLNFSKPFKQRDMFLLHMFRHSWYGMSLVVSNDTFMTSCVQSQNLTPHSFTMTNNAMHKLALLQINLLVVVYLEEHPCKYNHPMRFLGD